MADARVTTIPHSEGDRQAGHRVEIHEIGAGGAGVGRLSDGRIVFVHGTVPGEAVRIEMTEVRRDWGRGRLERVLRPAPGRRAAPCPWFGACGGCTLQHIEYPEQLAAKAGIVARALQRIGRFDWPTPAVEPSPLEFGYRNRVSVSLVRLGAGRVAAGFHALGEAGRIVDVGDDCLLPESPIRAAWAALRQEWGRNASRLPAGRQLRLTLRASEHGHVTLSVEGGHGPGRAEVLLERIPGLVAIWHRPESASRPRILAGAATLTETWNDEEADIAGGAFLQVNRRVASRLEDYVAERAEPVRGRRIVDAYCGIGTHARRFARLGAVVTGIELDPDAIDEARRQAGGSVEFLEGRVEALLPQALPADIIVVNPPRAGLDAAVCRQLNETPPRRLFYVSCDPATLARDLGRLRERHRLVDVRCFDLFPQTAHVETVVELECVIS